MTLTFLTLLTFPFVAGQADDSTVNTSHNVAVDKNAMHLFFPTGYYQKKSELCTFPITGDDCSNQFNDSLKIEPKGQSYLVELYSTQAAQNICAFSFQMDPVDSGLVFESPVGRVLLQQNGKSLKIISEGIDPTALGLGVCGIHADINNLEFPLPSTSPIDKAHSLDTYNPDRCTVKNH